MFVPGKPFQPSLMFVGKAGGYPSEAKKCWTLNTRRKYLQNSTGPNSILLLVALFTLLSKKLECLSQFPLYILPVFISIANSCNVSMFYFCISSTKLDLFEETCFVLD